MSLTNDSNLVMPVSPMNGSYGGGFGGGWGEGQWLWVLLLFAFMNGGWGNGFGGGGMDGMYPWLVNNTNQGFDQAATASALAGIQTSLTNGFSSQEVAACNRAMSQMQADYTNAIANLQQSFANAQALDSRLDTISQNQQNCCCQTQSSIKDLAYAVATEGCADRNAISSALRDVLEANNASTQRILDMMCQDKIDAKNEKIAELQNRLTMADLAASQNAQTAQLIADNTAQTQYLVNRISPYPIPAYTVPNPVGCNGYGYGMA